MAGIIFKWRYLKAGASGRHSENLIRYIAKREGVEKLDDSWKHRPVTKAQTKLITQILSDYPDTKDSFEYPAQPGQLLNSSPVRLRNVSI